MANEEYQGALMVVNQIQDQMAGLARAIVVALQDGRVSPFEGISLGFKGMSLASTIATFFSSIDRQDLDKVVHVLEHGDWTLPESAGDGYEMALMVVNQIQDQLAGLARSVVSALKDGRISFFEGISLGFSGMSLASSLATIMANPQPGELSKILFVLEHGDWTL